MRVFIERLEVLVRLSRAFWECLTRNEVVPVTRELADEDPTIASRLRLPATEYAILRGTTLGVRGAGIDSAYDDILRALVDHELLVTEEERLFAHRDLLNPLRVSTQLFENTGPFHPTDVQYIVMRAIRRYYQVTLTGTVSGAFQSLSDALTEELTTGVRERPWSEVLKLAVLERAESNRDAARYLDVFIECCRAANLFSLGRAAGTLWFYGEAVDSEYLLSRLFGLPVGIPGFDKLVGGGGLYLLDDLVELRHGRSRDSLPGRAVLATGRFGTGKSILALQFAVEVARKGGIAWVMPLEQSFSECIYALESMGMRLVDDAFRVARNLEEAQSLWEGPYDGRGALIFLRQPKDSYSEFIRLLEDNSAYLANYELRLLVIDPISAVHRDPSRKPSELRSGTVDVLRTLKDKVINLWINAEEDSMEAEHEFFEQNIADTVINLSSEAEQGFTQRYIEITKSRLQREIRSKHPFTIKPQRGIEIDLSPAAWSQIARGRTVRPPRDAGPFGTEGLNEILGEDGVRAFDLVVLQGPEGSAKTLIGLQFLLKFSHKPESHSFGRGHSLLVTDQEPNSTLQRLARIDPSDHRKPVHIVPVDSGFIQPGHILRALDDHIRRVRGYSPNFVDRVMIDNLARWEKSCPFIQQDQTFGVSLVEYLRRQSVTAVITCGDEPEDGTGSVLQKSVIDSADCLIRFFVDEVQGRSTVFLRVARTRDMKHRREKFQLWSTVHGVRVDQHPTPLRVDTNGNLTMPRVRLVVHRDNDAQHAYNQEILAAVKASISHHALIDESATFNTDILALGSASSLDEVQIVQLDEFQIPDQSLLIPVSESLNQAAYVGRISRKVYNNSKLIVAPYYVNISFVVHRLGSEVGCLSTWDQLVQEARSFQGEGIFFDCAFPNPQAYNCLFFEILLGLLKGTDNKPWSELYSEAKRSDFRRALETFQTLCAPAYEWHKTHGGEDIANARVWRCWYDTAGRLIDTLRTGLSASANRSELNVCPLPHSVSSAGEWYLAIPVYSDSPSIAQDIIRIYTSERAQRERLRMEIGLPCDAAFYEPVPSLGRFSPSISRHFSFDISVLMRWSTMR